jgi:hypothetical protein
MMGRVGLNRWIGRWRGMGGGRGHGGHNTGCVKVMMILWLKVDFVCSLISSSQQEV